MISEHHYFACLLILLLAGCASLDSRMQNAEKLASTNGFSREIINTERFQITTYQKLHAENPTLTVYLEGDGYAFVDRVTVSTNPTPVNAIGLKLAIADTGNNIVYIARPCMYMDLNTEPHCVSTYWTTRRYAPEIIDAISTAIDAIKTTAGADQVRLVGYSGGGTIAAVLAAKRDDVLDLRTLAGNLDIAEFARFHKVTPLEGSENPVDYVADLVTVTQRHYLGSEDEVIVPAISASYLDALRLFEPDLLCVEQTVVNAVSHNSGWENYWRDADHAVLHCRGDWGSE